MGRKLRITGLAMLVIVFLVLSACGTGKNSNTKSVSSNGTNQNSGDTKVPLGKKILSWPMLHGYLLQPVTTLCKMFWRISVIR